ncbi:MAG TPA: DUF4364 family protein [Candidatus Gallacutalibacter stercoravium]|nr:DUF4364 family protein [Candidatus Gallacutalibacter stercoravium]
MSFDALTAGVEPGGLRDKREIKLLICYMLNSVSGGLAKDDIISVLQNNGLANYFESNDAFADLLENDNIHCIDEAADLYQVTDSGRLIADQLDIVLPIAVRERALAATLNLLAQDKTERENRVRITKNEKGYTVECNVSGGDMNLMAFSLYVPDLLQARLVKRIFHKDPARVYRCMLALVTDNRDLAADLLSEIPTAKTRKSPQR